MSVVMTSVGYF